MQYLKLWLLLMYLVYWPVVNSQVTFLNNPFSIQLLRVLKDTLLNTFGSTSDVNNSIHKLSLQRGHIEKPIPESVPFPCSVTNGRSKTIPTSVHRLRPGDIDIIGAMGDSLTAGVGIAATNMANIFIENRGLAATGGGLYTWREYLTLPNILKTHHPASHFNVGENLAMSVDMPFMARNLVNRMKSDPKVDMKNHWKLISLLIGSNDICSNICYVHPPFQVLEDHQRDLIETFRILRDNLPRTIIILIPIPDIGLTNTYKGRPVFCDYFIRVACSCFNGEQFRSQREKLNNILRAWQNIDLQIQHIWEFQTEDFSVVTQSFGINMYFPKKPNGDLDLRYVSADCFHFSQIMNAAIAKTLWKSLFNPMNRNAKMEFNSKLFCPTEKHPFIITPKNNWQ